jgi:hypothetical protein
MQRCGFTHRGIRIKLSARHDKEPAFRTLLLAPQMHLRLRKNLAEEA